MAGSLLGIVACIWFLAFAAGRPPEARAVPPSPVPVVSVSPGSHDGLHLVSVIAHGVPLRAVLAEIARQAGFELVEMNPAEQTVSVEFTMRPLDEALKQILSRSVESFIFVYGGGSALKRVILLASGPPSGRASSGAGRSERAEVSAAEEVPDALPEGARGFDPDGPPEHLLILTDHRDPRMRTAALEALTLHENDERAQQKLIDHILDPDARIRLTALGLLGPFVTLWPGAEEAVMKALRDPVAGVRQLALQTLWEGASRRVSEALSLALRDEDKGVRDLAQELLHNSTVEGLRGMIPAELEIR